MRDALTGEQRASLTAEQTAHIAAQPFYMREMLRRTAMESNTEQRRLRQIERKRQLHAGEITRPQFDAEAEADPTPPMSPRDGADRQTH